MDSVDSSGTTSKVPEEPGKTVDHSSPRGALSGNGLLPFGSLVPPAQSLAPVEGRGSDPFLALEHNGE